MAPERHYLDEALGHVNTSRDVGDEVAALGSAAYALNSLWTAHGRMANLTGGDNSKLESLVADRIPESRQTTIASSAAVAKLANLTPMVMSMETLHERHYVPSDIDPAHRKEASDQHGQLYRAWKRFDEGAADSSAQQVVKKVAQLLYVIRSNIHHGEKTMHGPDKQNIERDRLVAVDASAVLDMVLDELLDRPSTRLAVYGTLRPGESNHSKIVSVEGTWTAGSILGIVTERMGYPSLSWQTPGDDIELDVLQSDQLLEHWARIDEFEGSGYIRSLVSVDGDDGLIVANAYLGRYASQPFQG